ncbi:MAG TPA: iron-sulfur cluster repair di-iron protein [Thermoanaerobaculia bacterium]
MDITPQTHVAEIVTHNPAATKVFYRHGIDFCCGGKRPLSEVCAERRLDPDQVRREIESLSPGDAGERDWSEAPLSAIVDHILERYHAPLREELPRLTEMAEKVARVHGSKFPEMFPALAARLRELRQELELHMVKEERVLFPYVVTLERSLNEGRPPARAPFGPVEGPISVMEAEHDDAGRLLEEMRRLSGGYQPPEGACGTFRALFSGLEALEKEMHLHVHLENNVLFPRVVALAG